ncbi:MAG: glycerate kinase [Clostridia bacterium]|nr:glycerate kinase [Clostridia bacterium]
MKVVVAIDSFKGSLSSFEVGTAVKNGILKVYNDASVIVLPIADGGEGTVDALTKSLNGKLKTVTVTNPLGDKIKATYGIIHENTAVIEMSSAGGITLIPKENLNPLKATTYGVGEMIKDAVTNGVTNFIIGIGGSATNDGGVGMLQALGFKFLDNNGNSIPFGAGGLKNLTTIDDSEVIPQLKNCTFNVACDVKNPLCGERGCSRVFSPQKGAKPNDIDIMDGYLLNYANLTKKLYPNSNKDLEGAGAAGGLGFAFSSYLNAKLTSGINLILDTINFESIIKGADVVVTGEGRMDKQSAMGKTPFGIATRAKKYNIPVIALVGSASSDSNYLNELGIDGIFPIVRGATSLQDAMNKENATINAELTAEQVFNFYKTIKG